MDDYSFSYRIIAEAQYIIDNGATIRETAKKFSLSKSAVHKDVSYKLKFIDEKLFLTCAQVLKTNLEERHIRGGNATKRKFMLIRGACAKKRARKKPLASQKQAERIK